MVKGVDCAGGRSLLSHSWVAECGGGIKRSRPRRSTFRLLSERTHPNILGLSRYGLLNKLPSTGLSPPGQRRQEPDLDAASVVDMDVKSLLAALSLAITPLADTAPSLELSFSDMILVIGEQSSNYEFVIVRSSEARDAVKLDLQVDATAVASFAEVTTDTDGCTDEANVITCDRTTGLNQGTVGVARVIVTAKDKVGKGQIVITATVDGVSMGPLRGTVEVVRQSKLTLVGANVKAPGKTKVPVKVGVRNVGKGPAFWPSPRPDFHPIAAYITMGAYVESVRGGPCFPWGPWPEGWGWLHPGEPSDRYACASGRIEPGQTSWYELLVVVDPQHPVVTGEISFQSGEKAAIVIDTRNQETLPVTGPRMRNYAIGAAALIVPGILLLLLGHRRTRRKSQKP